MKLVLGIILLSCSISSFAGERITISSIQDLNDSGISAYECQASISKKLEQIGTMVFASSKKEAVKLFLNKIDAFQGQVHKSGEVVWSLSTDKTKDLYAHASKTPVKLDAIVCVELER